MLTLGWETDCGGGGRRTGRVLFCGTLVLLAAIAAALEVFVKLWRWLASKATRGTKPAPAPAHEL